MIWECPICGSNAYSKQGGIYQPAYKYKQVDKTEVKEEIMYQTNSLFMCKGCSIFFNSPTKFNKHTLFF